MAKASIIQEASKGGCRFLHLQSEINAFATRWIQRLLDPSKPAWKVFVWNKIELATKGTNFEFLPKEWLFISKILPKDEKKILSHISNKDIWWTALHTYFYNPPKHPELSELSRTELENTPIYLNPQLEIRGEVIEPIIPELNTIWDIWDQVEERIISIRELKFQAPLTHLATIKALHERLLKLNSMLVPLMRNANQQLHLPIIVNSKPYQYL